MAVSAPIEIPFNKSHLVLGLIGALLSIALGVWFVVSAPTVRVPIPLEPGAVRALGAVGTVFFGLIVPRIVRQLRSKKPGLILTPEGLTDNSTSAPAGLFVSWAEVSHIKEYEISHQSLLLVVLHDPTAFIARQPSALTRRTMAIGLKTSGSPLQISVGSLLCTPESLQAAIQTRLAAWRARA